MCKVSVVIPIYNSEEFLEECLRSVVNQTLKDLEIICVNDGSTDSSRDIINTFAQNDSRIKVISQKNSGTGKAMNTGISAATGEFVGVVESDDFVETNMFERLYRIAEATNVEIVRSNYWKHNFFEGDVLCAFVDSSLVDKIFTPRDYPELFYLPSYLWSSIYRREFLTRNHILFNETPGASYQDVGFVFKALSCAERMTATEQAFYHYRVDNPNASIHSKEKVYCICDEFESIWHFLETRKDLYDQLKYITPYAQWKRYTETLGRIDDHFKYDFARRLQSEFKVLHEQRLISASAWSHIDFKDSQEIDRYTLDLYNRNIVHSMLKAGFLQLVRDANLYIYGAGQIGRAVAQFLHTNQKAVNGFLVTDASGNPTDIAGVPVLSFGAYASALRSKDVVLIAVKHDDVVKLDKEIFGKTAALIIPFDGELRQAIES